MNQIRANIDPSQDHFAHEKLKSGQWTQKTDEFLLRYEKPLTKVVTLKQQWYQ